MKHVVLFGGTFDPPHVGHLTMAQLALEQLQADALWFIPAPQPPHKMTVTPLDFETRVRMVEALIEGTEGMTVSRIEERLPKPSYTVDTVRLLRTEYPDLRYTFLMGSDSLAQLPTWHRAAELVQLVPFAVAVRSGYPFESAYAAARAKLPGLRALPLEMPLLDVSSTWLRERLAAGRPVCDLVPNRVLAVWTSRSGSSGDTACPAGERLNTRASSQQGPRGPCWGRGR